MSPKDQASEFSWNIHKRLLGFTRSCLTRIIFGVLSGVLYGLTAFGLIIVIYGAGGSLGGEPMGPVVMRVLEVLHPERLVDPFESIETASEMGFRKGGIASIKAECYLGAQNA